ncbi:hypothetical protein [Thermococcus piezophilus]|uniref:hypothetical protein n=1 Tax=Thermococcus piezophilus TaxID=1712654 RepID=UPI000B0AD7C2|nr:hypothetical protein [Thermococcus piezophilus]
MEKNARSYRRGCDFSYTFLPVFQACEEVPYQTIEKYEVPVNYKVVDASCYGTSILDWEIECTVKIENADSQGGTFTVTLDYSNSDSLAYSTSDSKYTGPGQSVEFRFKSSGLSYSTDWKSRYSVDYDINPLKKIETRVVTKYRKECRSVNLILGT